MSDMFKIINKSADFAQINDFEEICSEFLPHAKEYLRFDKPISVELVSDPKNAKDPFGKTAYYDPNAMKITLFVDKRHVKDILRSLSHELVHHAQNCRGEFDEQTDTQAGYAQKDPHMRKCEAEAYLHGNGLMWRDFEDLFKEKRTQTRMISEKETYLLTNPLQERKNMKKEKIMSNFVNEIVKVINETKKELSSLNEKELRGPGREDLPAPPGDVSLPPKKKLELPGELEGTPADVAVGLGKKPMRDVPADMHLSAKDRMLKKMGPEWTAAMDDVRAVGDPEWGRAHARKKADPHGLGVAQTKASGEVHAKAPERIQTFVDDAVARAMDEGTTLDDFAWNLAQKHGIPVDTMLAPGGKGGVRPRLEESTYDWTLRGKNDLLYEELVKKWCKSEE